MIKEAIKSNDQVPPPGHVFQALKCRKEGSQQQGTGELRRFMEVTKAMQSNLPERLAIYKYPGGSAVFAFHTGAVRRHEHQTLTQTIVHAGRTVTDIYGSILQRYPGYVTEHHTYKGTIWLRTVTGQDLQIEYREPKFACTDGQKINAVFCNDRFVGFENYDSRLQHYLWRAVDQHGATIDILVQLRRDRWAALRFFRKLLDAAGRAPQVIVTDKLRSYAAAKRKILPGVEHRQSRYLNNRAENSHQPTRIRKRL